MRKVSYLSYNMTTADANNPDGIVPVGRQFDFIGDVETEEMILVDGDESLCLGYEDVKIYQDVYVGDMMEYKATLTHIGNTSRDCRIEVFKLATPAYRAGKEDYKPGDMESILKIPGITIPDMALIIELQKETKANTLFSYLGGGTDEQSGT